MLNNKINFQTILRGIYTARKNVMWKDSVMSFSLNALKNAYLIKQDLANGKYRIARYQRFTISEPKVRDILATNFRDRALQHALCDEYFYDEITRHFIRANCACLKGRGGIDAIELMQDILHEFYRKHGLNGWVLQCDIKSFFPSTPHSTAKASILKRVRDKDARRLAYDIIDSFAETSIADDLEARGVRRDVARKEAHRINTKRIYEGSDRNENFRGIALGSQISQLTELAVLDDLDHYIKERLRIRCYIRYMDDFILIHEDREHIKYCLDEIRKKVECLGLRLNPKTHIFKLSHGINFLKWRFFLTSSGKLVMRKDKSRITKARRKLKRLKQKVLKHELTLKNVEDSFQSWQSGLYRYGCHYTIRKMRGLFFNLFHKEASKCKKCHYSRHA